MVQIRRELGITVVIVEQNAAVALDIADYGYVLENGRIVLDGDRERLQAMATFRSSTSANRKAASGAVTARQTISPQPEVVWLNLSSKN